MRSFIIFISFFSNSVLMAQQDCITKIGNSRSPYNPNGHYQTWGLKGNLIPFPWGNSGGFNSLIGSEFGFLKNHSIGVDLFRLSFSEVDDHIKDNAGKYYDAYKISRTIDKAIFVNYRYYFRLHKLDKFKNYPVYSGLFYRYGHRIFKPNALFLAQNDSILSKKETHISGGILFGTLIKFPNQEKFGLDINLGIFYKKKEITTVRQTKNNLTNTVEHPANFGARVGFNLYWWFYR